MRQIIVSTDCCRPLRISHRTEDKYFELTGKYPDLDCRHDPVLIQVAKEVEEEGWKAFESDWEILEIADDDKYFIQHCGEDYPVAGWDLLRLKSEVDLWDEWQ